MTLCIFMYFIKFIFLLLFLTLWGCRDERSPSVIEINTVPPPFDINGRYPYVVWVNGERVDMSRGDVLALVKKIGKENIKMAESSNIHKGWLYSYLRGDPANEFESKKRR